MASDPLDPPMDSSFGDLLDWHLLRGIRPPGSDKQGKPWKKSTFAGDVGVSDKQLRNWIANKSLPTDTITIERILFGRDQKHRVAWRNELRDALKRSRSAARAQVPAPPDPLADKTPASRPVPASNIPIRVPTHFMGRDDALTAIAVALARYEGRVAITALHGLRGVGKTTLAAAYAERHRGDYHATWWIRAQADTTMRADLVALGIRLGWVGADDKEEPSLAAVMERLRHEGDGILLIFDNAINADALKPYLPRGGTARVLVTSNAHAWRGVAAPVEIRLWPKEIGADYLIARTGRDDERAEAETLSEVLGGLPLAHEQAAAYCERLAVAFVEYRKRFAAAPARLLDDARHAPAEYGLTVAKTFALAIAEAARLHPAAETLIVHAALLAPEPIPLYLFAEAREQLGEQLASAVAGDGLDEAVAALRTFALLDRETIEYERDPAMATDAIRLHRLVREVATAKCDDARRDSVRGKLIAALTAVYPGDGYNNPGSWPRCAALTPHVIAIGEMEIADVPAITQSAALLDNVGSYFHRRAAYTSARALFERALAMREKVLGPEHPDTAMSLNNLAFLVKTQGDPAAARPLYERALAICEKVRGPEHPDTAASLNNVAALLEDQGELAAARTLKERALAICEKVLGPEHTDTALSLNNLALLLKAQGDPAAARPLYERALAIYEKVLGPQHPNTAASLNNLAGLLRDQGDLAAARPLYERALAIDEKVLGPEHPDTAMDIHNLASLLQAQGDLAAARPLFERALAIREKVLGPAHPRTNLVCRSLARLALAIGEPGEAFALANRALTHHEKTLGPDHRWTKDSAATTADALDALGRTDEAKALRARCGLGDRMLSASA